MFVPYFLFLERKPISGYIKLSMEKVSNEEERLLLTLASPDLCAGFFSLFINCCNPGYGHRNKTLSKSLMKG